MSYQPLTTAPIRVGATTNLIDLGVKPGWFVRKGACSIWQEVKDVWDTWLTCAARDPKQITDHGHVGNAFSAIDEVCEVPPLNSSWITLKRRKSFYDKFHPELDKITPGAYIPPHALTPSST
ncbi:hypothetical protein ACSVIJ_05410 [Pseudomonas sp. NCHU5208]|uniref:hypothetical protein n=1 Tax=unclassified Pseudomonas TaxID=196821 RepID=UPI003F9C0524